MTKIAMMQLALAVTLLLGGCKKKSDNNEGALESAGEEADKKAADVSEKAEETAEDADHAIEEAGDAVEEKTDK